MGDVRNSAREGTFTKSSFMGFKDRKSSKILLPEET
jgi:hypothetical protein